MGMFGPNIWYLCTYVHLSMFTVRKKAWKLCWSGTGFLVYKNATNIWSFLKTWSLQLIFFDILRAKIVLLNYFT